tara:strand:- start:2487 stop:2729 length:243 start_codon:yes stop_codon:yes gene_type:complete
MNKIKWIKTRNEYAKKNIYITSEAIDGAFYITTNDTPNGNWNLYEVVEMFDPINDNLDNMETIEMFHTLSEVKATVKSYK